jgi:hypothetical protein
MTEDPPSPELTALIAEFEASGFAELHLQMEGFEVRLRNDETSDQADA